MKSKKEIKPHKIFAIMGFARCRSWFWFNYIRKKAAMLCTASVEEVIDEHYQNQINQIESDEKELRNKIIKFREDELNHKDIAYNEGATKDGLYSIIR